MPAKIISINLSTKKGVKKTPVKKAKLIFDLGVESDAHAQGGNRQISLMAIEDISQENLKLKTLNHKLKLKPGDFAENITTKGLDLSKLKVSDKLKIGETVIEISQLGKTCHNCCQIYKTLGNCLMPKKGIFAKVVVGGRIKLKDKIIVLGTHT